MMANMVGEMEGQGVGVVGTTGGLCEGSSVNTTLIFSSLFWIHLTQLLVVGWYEKFTVLCYHINVTVKTLYI